METKKLDKHSLFFSKQLGSETTKKLLSLDLANNPEAEKHLILFLQAMGISQDEMSPLLKGLNKRSSMEDFLVDSAKSLSKNLKEHIIYFAGKE